MNAMPSIYFDVSPTGKVTGIRQLELANFQPINHLRVKKFVTHCSSSFLVTVPKPDLDAFVFCRAKEHIGNVRIDEK